MVGRTRGRGQGGRGRGQGPRKGGRSRSRGRNGAKEGALRSRVEELEARIRNLEGQTNGVANQGSSSRRRSRSRSRNRSNPLPVSRGRSQNRDFTSIVGIPRNLVEGTVSGPVVALGTRRVLKMSNLIKDDKGKDVAVPFLAVYSSNDVETEVKEACRGKTVTEIRVHFDTGAFGPDVKGEIFILLTKTGKKFEEVIETEGVSHFAWRNVPRTVIMGGLNPYQFTFENFCLHLGFRVFSKLEAFSDASLISYQTEIKFE